MKSRLVLVTALLLGKLLTPSFAQPSTEVMASAGATVTSLMAQIRAAAPEDRQALIESAIATNPSLASGLVAALIAAFPNDAALMTKIVVDAVLGLGFSNTAKAEILTAVAQSAVQAALQIPSTAVSDLVSTVNAVKDALANVPVEFSRAVAAYIIPITELPRTIINNTNNTPRIVSGDTL